MRKEVLNRHVEPLAHGSGEVPFVQTSTDRRFPWFVRLFFWNQRRRYGKVLEPARLWARSPSVFVTLALMYGALDRRSSPLDPRLRSLLTVRVSQVNWGAFFVDINSATLLRRGAALRRKRWPRSPSTPIVTDSRPAKRRRWGTQTP